MSCTILIVDDEHLLARSLEHWLREYVERVLVATSAGDAIVLLGLCRSLELALVDVDSGGADGVVVGNIIRERFPTARVVFMSASPRERLALDRTAELLEKPFAPETLMALLPLRDHPTA